MRHDSKHPKQPPMPRKTADKRHDTPPPSVATHESSSPAGKRASLVAPKTSSNHKHPDMQPIAGKCMQGGNIN